MAVFLTPNTKFKPFSYQEMLAPVLAYKEAYDATDEELNTLMEDAATKAFNFGPQDFKEKAQYDAMMTKLRTASANLASGDINAFKDIRNLNKEYRQTMIPINQKIAKRAELAAEQRKYLSVNPNLRFDVDYSSAKLDDITDSSTYSMYNLDTITKDVEEEMSKFIKGIPRTDFDPIPIGNTSNVLVKTGYGYDSEEFDKQIVDPNSALYKLYQSKINNLNPNMPDGIKQEAIKEIYNTMKANAGLFSFDTVIDYSTKPSSKSRGGKGTQKPEIQYGQEGDKVVAITYNGKMMTAEVEWIEEDGKKVPKIKAETIKGIPNAKGETASDKEIVTVTEIFDSEGELLKTTQQTKTTRPTGEVAHPADSTAVAGTKRGFRG